jgi:hypothetical protein
LRSVGVSSGAILRSFAALRSMSVFSVVADIAI